MYHILFCEDNAAFIEYMKQVILKAGVTQVQVQFHEFLSGEGLLAYLELADARCDLLILDTLLMKTRAGVTLMFFLHIWKRKTVPSEPK